MTSVDQTNPGAALTERIASIPVRVSHDVELHDAAGNEVLFWLVDGAIHVHPARIMLMREAVVGRKMAFPAALAVAA